jgi:two-component system sensor histidine kinase RegB
MEPMESLRQLMLMRNVLMVGLAVAFAVVERFFSGPLPGPFLAALIALLALANLATFCRLRLASRVSEGELLGQSLVDVAVLTIFFFLSGGATNPFIDFFLVPLAAAAASLPRRHLLWLAPLTLACYLLLVRFHVPLPAPADGASGFLCFGMWLKYVLLGGFVAWLVHHMASRLRLREQQLAQALQRSQNRDYLVRVGTLAAAAAHEIASPLCTMSVVANELLRMHADRPDLTQSLRLMLGQIDGCRRLLSQLTRDGQTTGEDARAVPVDSVLREVVERWRVLRPAVNLRCMRSGTRPPPLVPVDDGLGHAIMNLLNNAADASPGGVEMHCTWNPAELKVSISDTGPGIAAELHGVLGERVYTSKQSKGTGIGLLLARAAIDGAGGTLCLSTLPGGGACAQIVVPLHGAPG